MRVYGPGLLMKLAIKGYDAGSTPANQIANLRAGSSASRMLRGRQFYSLEFRLQAVRLGNPNAPPESGTPNSKAGGPVAFSMLKNKLSDWQSDEPESNRHHNL